MRNDKSRVKASASAWAVAVVFVIVVITQVVAPYRGWRLLIVGLGGGLFLSWLWALSLAKGVDLRREMRFGWAQVGDRLVERFTLRNDKWAPAVWAEVGDESTMPNYRVSRGTGVPAHDSIRWHTEAICMQRGLFTLGPTHLETGDPFGFFTVEMDFPASLPLLILPPIVQLPQIEVASGGRSGEARPRANVMDQTVSAASVREYVPGDSLRWIHWRTTARLNDFYVRLFDATPAGDWWILLDMDQGVQIGEGQNATDEHGVILSASLADRGVRRGKAVGLIAQGEQLVWMKPEEGEGHRWEILRSLALIDRGSRPLADVLSRVAPSIGRSSSLVIITPSTENRWVESLVPLVRRGVIPTVLLLEPQSFGGEGAMTVVEQSLTNLGVVYYEITQDMLDQPAAQPGRQGVWEWRVLGTGRAVAVDKQRDAMWRSLT